MGEVKGFLKYKRQNAKTESESREQASRCMDCGTPFCHWACPLGNYIPEWNDAVHNQQWKKAYELLAASNNMPEITGRVCPALCEYSCVLGINDDPITIRDNELAIIEHAFEKGWVAAKPPKERTGKKVAIVGSGPAGLSCADELNKKGHKVTVFERDDGIGGILRFGIPDFKLDKKILDRRINIWQEEGVTFKTKTNIDKVPAGFDAVCFTCGSRIPRDLEIPGREGNNCCQLSGIHFAMDYLTKPISAKGKQVVVIGGGDTGADCVGTAYRQGASSITQIEVLPKPPECRPLHCPWPKYPMLLKASSCPEDAVKRQWLVTTKEFAGKNGKVTKLICETRGREFEIEADLVILAIGFIGPELIKGLDLKQKGIFTAGDMRRGQSLIVWAIYEGRRAADEIESYLSA